MITFIVLSYLLVKNRKTYHFLLVRLIAAGLAAYASNRIVHERIDLIFSDMA